VTVASNINAIYYAMRLINHRVDISHLRAAETNESSSEEFSQDERAHALRIIETIQEKEGSSIQSLSESKIEDLLNTLADEVEELASKEISDVGSWYYQAADQFLRESRSVPLSWRGVFHTDVKSSPLPPGYPHESSMGGGGEVDLVCLSHLRWDFVYQRPQHLLSRCAKGRRVFYVEEPLYGAELRLDVTKSEEGVHVVVPHLPERVRGRREDEESLQQALLSRLFAEYRIREHVLWYYTPMALGWSRHLRPVAVVYDCMDELAAFKFAPAELREREAELFRRADLVFTGGQSLYEAKRGKHPHVYAFPNGIDRKHFGRAREISKDPEDQAAIPHPRLGFFGVVDERLDLELLGALADERPEWQFVIIGPVVKIDPETLPRRENIHYLGGKSYKELPAYLAGWDVATLLFARNEHTRYISPTKTPEYLAAGKPVVSTSIRDVVRPYGETGLVKIADEPREFAAAADELMKEGVSEEWLARVDAFLAQNTWDRTWARMEDLIVGITARRVAAREATNVTTGLGRMQAAGGATRELFLDDLNA
jgi:glycosyltransferase involved in cell wall biosynthesis